MSSSYCLVILATKNSELLPQNMAFSYSCRLRGLKSVRLGNGLPLTALRHLVLLPVIMALGTVDHRWPCPCKWQYMNVKTINLYSADRCEGFVLAWLM